MAWTLTTLKSAIQDYTDNSETTFVNDLNTIILNAEDRIMSLVDLPDFRKNATGTISSGSKYLAMPTDFLAPFSLSVTSSSNVFFLINKDVNFIQESFPVTTTTGRPEFYAILLRLTRL